LKQWNRIGDRESLAYAGINFHKPIDEEQLVKEIKRRKKLNNRKLEDNRRGSAHKLTDITYPQNSMTIGVVVENEKNGLPKRSVCVFSKN
jgi:hypothetical protein